MNLCKPLPAKKRCVTLDGKSMTQEPHFSNWKDAWEWHAQQTHEDLARYSVPELLERIRAGRYDPYFTIWYVLREKATLSQSAAVLLNVLRRESGENSMLVRYHCAAALFHLLGYPDEPMPPLRERVQWDHQGETARLKAVSELEALVAKRLSG